MNSKNNLFIKISWIFLITFLLYTAYNCYVYLVCFSASHQISQNVDQEILRIKIYGSSNSPDGNTVSGSFSIIDSNGNEIAVIERSWTGSYLAVDFVQAKFNGNYYVFPSRIFGKNRIIEVRNERKKGIELSKYYNDYGQCMLLGYGSTLKDRKNLYKISQFTNSNFLIFNFGIVNTYTLDLSNCKTNIYYSIKVDEFGEIYIQDL